MPDVLPRVYEPFFTTKPSGKGSGLGLSMVYGFVTQSGWRVRIDSIVSKGTAVTLHLPLAEAAVESDRSSGSFTSQILGDGQAVLLVEDDDDVRVSVERQLRSLGYDVLAVDSGDAAVEGIKSGAGFDLLLTDVELPGRVDGTTVALEALGTSSNIGIVCMTGYTDSNVELEMLAREGVGISSKPFSRIELGEALRQAKLSAVRRSIDPQVDRAGGHRAVTGLPWEACVGTRRRSGFFASRKKRTPGCLGRAS